MSAKLTLALVAWLAVGPLWSGAVLGEDTPDINNPIEFYFEQGGIDGKEDSLLTTRVTFDQLPEYDKPTHLTVEHRALFATDSGLMVELRGEAVERVMLDMSFYAKLVPGPIAKGDSIRVEFELTPREVGIIPLSLVIYDNVALVPNKPIRVGVMGDVPFILNPEGKTFGIASAAASKLNSTVLGPAPDLLNKTRIFRIKPRYPQQDLRWLDLEERPNHIPEEEIFSIQADVVPVPDRPEKRIVRCRVQPYQDFEHGIALQVTHNDLLSVSNLDSCVIDPVSADSVYDFSFDTELLDTGLGHLTINFITPNPDFGVEGALFQQQPRALSVDLKLTFGINDNKAPLFITDVPLKRYRHAADKVGVDPTSIDSRFDFVTSHWQDEYPITTEQAPGFPLVIVHLKP